MQCDAADELRTRGRPVCVDWCCTAAAAAADVDYSSRYLLTSTGSCTDVRTYYIACTGLADEPL